MTKLKIEPFLPEDFKVFLDRTGVVTGRDSRGFKAVLEDEVLGCIVADSWTPNAATLHIWIGDSRALVGGQLFKTMCEFVFVHGHRGLVHGTIPSNNEASLKLSKSLGFKEIARLPNGWDVGIDIVVVSLHKEDCQWLSKEAA